MDHRKLKRAIQKQSLEDKLEVINNEIWPVDPSYSMRKKSDTLDAEGTATNT